MPSAPHPALPPTAFSEAVACWVRGLRDAFSLRLLLTSAALWLGALLLWGLLLVFAHDLLRAVGGWIAAWGLLGLFVWFPGLLPESWQAKLVGVPLTEGAANLLGWAYSTAAWLAVVLLVILGIVATARVAMEFFLMPQVQRQVVPQYPPLAPPLAKGRLWDPVVRATRFGVMAACGLPLLLIPVVNIIVSFGFFGYLNVRTLVNDALENIASPEEQRAVVRASRGRLVLLGALLTAAFMLPLVGLLGPAWTGAATCHLCVRALRRQRG
jgi:hypothetical protein